MDERAAKARVRARQGNEQPEETPMTAPLVRRSLSLAKGELANELWRIAPGAVCTPRQEDRAFPPFPSRFLSLIALDWEDRHGLWRRALHLLRRPGAGRRAARVRSLITTRLSPAHRLHGAHPLRQSAKLDRDAGRAAASLHLGRICAPAPSFPRQADSHLLSLHHLC